MTSKMAADYLRRYPTGSADSYLSRSQQLQKLHRKTREALAFRDPPTEDAAETTAYAPNSTAAAYDTERDRQARSEMTRRMDQLRSLRARLLSFEELFLDALKKDLGKPRQDALLEWGVAVMHIDSLLSNDGKKLKEWNFGAASKQLKDTTWNGGKQPALIGSALWSLRQEAKGVVLHMMPWNYPIYMAFAQTANLLAAGNCVVLKPSEYCSASAEAVWRALCFGENDMTDGDSPKASLEGVDVFLTPQGLEQNREIMEKCVEPGLFDHVCYTGSGPIGKIVYQHAAKSLTPVTLELGGKSPVIFDTNLGADCRADEEDGARMSAASGKSDSDASGGDSSPDSRHCRNVEGGRSAGSSGSDFRSRALDVFEYRTSPSRPKQNDLSVACRRVAWSKVMNCGQTCVAADYILARESMVPAIVGNLLASFAGFFPKEQSPAANKSLTAQMRNWAAGSHTPAAQQSAWSATLADDSETSGCPAWGRVVHARHWDRLRNMCAEVQDFAKSAENAKSGDVSVILGGTDSLSEDEVEKLRKERMFPMTIILVRAEALFSRSESAHKLRELGIMKEEFFGPVLLVIGLPDESPESPDFVRACSDFVNAPERKNPLALYVMTSYGRAGEYSSSVSASTGTGSNSKNDTLARLLAAIPSGDACVNELIHHSASQDLPFGGVGASGFGTLNGKAGFHFSAAHPRSVFGWKMLATPGGTDLLIAERYPPYNAKNYGFMRAAVTGDFWGLLMGRGGGGPESESEGFSGALALYAKKAWKGLTGR